MKVSEAIRLGSMMDGQIFGALETNAGTCAFGAAMKAAAIPLVRYPKRYVIPFVIGSGSEATIRHSDLPPTGTYISPPEWAILFSLVACPECFVFSATLTTVIPHLNDTHRWTRERIADFVQGLEDLVAQGLQVDTEAWR